MGIEIVDMREEHLAEIAELEKMCFSLPWSENSLLEEIGNSEACFLVAVEANKVIGYIGSVMTDGCYITNVAVFPHSRGRGAGSLLIKALEAKAAGRKCEFITLEVRIGNSGAIALYSRLGFQKLGERRDFYVKPTENALIMTKQLV